MPEEIEGLGKPVNLGGVVKGLPVYEPVNPNLGNNTVPSANRSFDDMYSNAVSNIKPRGADYIDASGIDLSGRSKYYYQGRDNEEIAAQQQSTWSKWGNGFAKMAGTAGSTFLSDTVGLVAGIGSMIKDGRFASLYDNPVNNSLDQFNKEMENYLPNHYTHAESDASWYSPDNILTANFFSDKVIKNLGFSIGSMAGGFAWGGALKAIGLTSKLIQAGKGLETVTAVENAIATAPKIGRYGAITNSLEGLSNQFLRPAGAALLNNSERGIISVMGTMGEASIESLQNLNETRNNMIKSYVDTYGKPPEGADLNELNSYAEKVGNFTWGMNVALLSATNYIQLPKIMNTSKTLEKRMMNDIVKEGLEEGTVIADRVGAKYVAAPSVLEKVAGKPGKLFNKYVAKPAGLLFAPMEAFEEGAQFAVQTGTQSYFQKAYNTNKSITSFWSNLSESMGDVLTEGVTKALTTKEGLESILIGGLSGGLQTSFSPFGANTIKERGIFGDGGFKGKNTQIAIDAINNSKNLNEVLKDGVRYANIAINSQTARQQDIANDDTFSEKNHEKDYALAYIMPRAKYGKIESVKEEVNQYKQQAMSDQGFKELVNSGVVNEGESREQFITRLNNIVQTADQVSKTYNMFDDKYSALTDKEGKKLYSDATIEKMVYASAKVLDFDNRSLELQSKLAATPGIDTLGFLQVMKNSKAWNSGNLDKLQDEPEVDTFIKNTLDFIKDDEFINAEDIRQDFLDFAEVTAARKSFIDEFNDIKANPAKQDVLDAVNQIELQRRQEIVTREEEDKGVPIEQLQQDFDTEKTTKQEAYDKEREKISKQLEAQKSDAERQAKYDARQKELEQAFEEVPKVSSIKENQIVTRNGVEGRIVYDEEAGYQFNPLGTNQYIDLGTKEDLPLYELGIKESKLPAPIENIDITANGQFLDITINGKSYQNLYSNPMSAINYDKNGNIVSVTLTGEKGNVTFKKYAEEVAYSILLHTYQKLNDENQRAAEEFAKRINQPESEGKKPEVATANTAESQRAEEELDQAIGIDEDILVNQLINAESIDDLTNIYNQLSPENQDKYKDFFTTAKDHLDVKDKTFINNLSEKQNLSDDMINNVATQLFSTMNQGIQNAPTTGGFEAESKKSNEIVGNATAGPSQRSFTQTGEVVSDHHARADKFGINLPNLPNQSSIKGVVVTAATEGGIIPGLANFLKQGKEFVDTDTTISLVMAIPSQDGKSYTLVDENGKEIAKQQPGESDVDYANRLHSSAIFQTFPSNLDRFIRDSTSIEERANLIAKYNKWRTETLNSTNTPNYNIQASLGTFDRVKKEDGITSVAVEDSNLIDAKDLTGKRLIYVPTVEDTITLGSTSFTRALGKPFLILNNAYVALKNKLHSPKEASAIYDVLHRLSSIIVEENAKGGFSINNSPEAVRLIDWLRSVTYWGTPKAGVASLNSIWFDKTATGFKLLMSGKTDENGNYVAVSEFNPTELEKNKDAILANLVKMYNNTNAKKTDDAYYNERYEQIISISRTGEIEYKVWPNYQSYLLSNKSPDANGNLTLDRDSEDIPLTTNIRPITSAEDTNRHGVYFIINKNDIDKQSTDIAPTGKAITITAPTEKKEEAPKEEAPVVEVPKGKFELDGKTANTIELKNGSITFVYDEKKPGILKSLDIDPKVSEAYIPNIKQEIIDKFIADRLAEGETVSIQDAIDRLTASAFGAYVLNQIKLDEEAVAAAKAELLAKQIEEQAPVVSDIEAKKADIEKRRQEELKLITKTPERAEEWKEIIDDVNAKYNAELAALEGNVLKINQTERGDVRIPTEEGSRRVYINSPEFKEVVQQLSIEQIDKWKNWLKGELADIPNRIEKETKRSSKDYQGSNAGLKNIRQTEQDYKNTLAALETKPTEENKPTGPGKMAGRGQNNKKKFRLFGKDVKERMSDAELQLFKEWHAENVPNIPYEVLEKIITTYDGEKAWGVFEDGVAKFVKGGLRATEYHEIFEAIYAGMLSSEEQQGLLDEFKARSGKFTDRQTGKKIAYDEATDLQAKERIADDFADYRKGKLPARSLGERIQKFFRMIMDFFKSFVTKPTLKSELFKAIDTGKFKEKTLSESASDFTEYSKVGDLTNQETHEFVQDITAISAGILYSEKDKNILYSSTGIMTSKELFDKVKQIYTEEEKEDDGFNRIDLLSDREWNELVEKSKQSLRILGYTFTEGTVIDTSDETKAQNEYAREAFTEDVKQNSSKAIKFTLGTLPQVKPTNQQDELSLELPQVEVTSIGGYKLLNFSRAFATVLDRLANTSSVKKMISKLTNLANEDANYVRLHSRVGGMLDGGKAIDSVPFNQFNKYDWRLFIEFMQTFTKQKPEALIQYKTGNEVYIGPANLYTVIQQTKQGWMENMKTLSTTGKGYIKYNKPENVYQIDTDKIKGISVRGTTNMLDFLGKIGVNVDINTYNKFSKAGQTTFAGAVESIYNYFGENNNIMSVTKETLGINGPLSTIATLINNATNPNQESTYYGVEGEKIGAYAESNNPSVFENEFNEANTIDELLALRPELKDLFSTNSQFLKRDGLFFDKNGVKKKDVKIKYIQGTKENDANKGIKTSNINLGDRFTQEINNNINGEYYILLPGDSSTEWMMNIGNNITFKELQKDKTKTINKINTIFRGYLSDDVALALDADNRKQLKNIGSKANELRFFKDILNNKDLIAINNLIAKNATQKEIEDYINDKENIGNINDAIQNYIDSTVEETRELLSKNNQIYSVGDNEYSYLGLQDAFINSEKLDKTSLSEEELNDILKFANTNYIINNIEYHKILFGDPFQFAIKNGKLDETKRIKSFLSPRRVTIDFDELNNGLNDIYNQVDDITLDPEELGSHLFKSHTDTISIKDVKLAGSLSNIISKYDDTNEADAASLIADTTYREVKLKNGQWSDQAEDWHKWQMAWTRQNLPNYKYKSEALKANDIERISKPAPKHKIEVLKPIVSGNKFNRNQFDLVLDKFSQMPIYYSMVKGTNMEKLYLQMFNQKIGYAVFESGRKVGVEKVHSLYNADGTYNNEAFAEDTIVQVPWKAYGIQVETASQDDKEQTRGSQLTKMSSMDLFNNGVSTSEEAKKEYLRNKDILNKMTENAFNELMNRLGLVDLGNGFVMTDGKKISETLVHEMLRREVSQNTIDAIQLDENDQFRIPFEAAPSYVQIRSIIYSMIDKSINRPMMNGGAHVQVPSTMFESATKGRALTMKNNDGKWIKITTEQYNKLTEDQKKGVVLTDDTLKFYTKDSPYCEILLPHWFKSKFGKKSDEEILKYLNSTEEGQSILRGIGFRIPTQALSSVEVFKVKGFLPQYMGATVVVPSEITTKAGSDFDIDKLNMYLKSTYVDRNGDVRLVKYLGSEELTKEFYSKVFDDKLENKQLNKGKLLEALQISVYGLDDPNNLTEKYADAISTMLAESVDPNNLEESIISEINKLTDTNIQQYYKDKFVKDMYKKSLENEYYDSLEKLVTLPENFERLITPVDDAGLEKLANKLDALRGYNESGIKNRILNRNYMTTLRNTFTMAKKWVGIAAVNITNLSLKQKSKVYIDPARFEKTSKQDQKFLGDGNIVLKHNTVVDNGERYISLSGTKTADGKEFISHRLSGYATSFVDVANNPYITKIIQSNLVVGTYMFLENIGAGEQTAMFLNQPIIAEYLQYLDSIGAKGLFNKKNIEYIKNEFGGERIKPGESFGTAFDVNNLEQNIKDYYSNNNEMLNGEQDAEQESIFNEFLKYAKMAEYAFKFTQATNYDTAKFKDSGSFSRKTWMTDVARNTNIISSVDNVLNDTHIGVQKKALADSMEAMGAIFKLDQNDLRVITDDILKPYGEDIYLSNDKFDRLSLKVKSDFLDYIIQTNSRIGISENIKYLLENPETAVASKLEKLQKDYPEIQLLQELEVVSSIRPGGAKSISLKANLKDAYDEDLYTGMMRELRDYNNELKDFYKGLVRVSILQGTYQSAISIKNVIPIEDYSAIVKPIFDAIVATPAMDNFANESFAANNFKNDDIMPLVNPKFFKASDEPVAEQLNYFGEHYADIYQYYSALFPSIDAFSIKSSERKILLLSEKWNSFDVKNDFIKVPRVITDKKTGESIDMVTGLTITKKDYVTRKKKGDYTLQDVFGYRKVKINGEPLITYDKDGEAQHVYKLFNLLGDGDRASEHYAEFKESVFENGTVKINHDIPDANIIEYYGGKITAKDVSLQEPNMVMQPDNVQKILSGEKTTTLRTESFPSGTYNFGGKDFQVTNRGLLNIQEAGGVEAISKSEAFAETGPKYPSTKDFLEGKRKLYVYDISPVVEPIQEESAQDEISRLQQELSNLEFNQQELNDNSTELIVANNLPKILPASAKKETGLITGTKGDIGTSLLSTNGVTVDKAAHDIWENSFTDTNIDTQGVKDIIIDILNAGSVKAYKENVGINKEINELKAEIKEKQAEAKPKSQQLDLFKNAPEGLPPINRSPKQC